MNYEFLTTTRDGPVERLTLNRPEVRNAFNDQMIAELTAWASGVHAQAAGVRARVVILNGAGKAFSAGADLAWMSRAAQLSEEDNERDALAAARMWAALDSLPVPLIGRVHGAALGGGAGLAAVCDIVVAADDATFGFTEVKLGVLPATIAPFVLAKVGPAVARELFLTGARFSATRAREIGLVTAVVPAEGLDEAISRFVGELLTAGPEAIAATKTLIRDVSGRAAADVALLTARAIAARRVSPEGQEGLRAFLEKRAPHWSSGPITSKDTKDTKE